MVSRNRRREHGWHLYRQRGGYGIGCAICGGHKSQHPAPLDLLGRIEERFASSGLATARPDNLTEEQARHILIITGYG